MAAGQEKTEGRQSLATMMTACGVRAMRVASDATTVATRRVNSQLKRTVGDIIGAAKDLLIHTDEAVKFSPTTDRSAAAGLGLARRRQGGRVARESRCHDHTAAPAARDNIRRIRRNATTNRFRLDCLVAMDANIGIRAIIFRQTKVLSRCVSRCAITMKLEYQLKVNDLIIAVNNSAEHDKHCQLPRTSINWSKFMPIFFLTTQIGCRNTMTMCFTINVALLRL